MPSKSRNTITRRSRRTRLPPTSPTARVHAALAGQDFMTAAEVRGEAAYLVLQTLLPRIPRPVCLSVMAQAYANADSLGIPEVTNEVNALFSAIAFSQG